MILNKNTTKVDQITAIGGIVSAHHLLTKSTAYFAEGDELSRRLSNVLQDHVDGLQSIIIQAEQMEAQRADIAKYDTQESLK